MPISKVNNPLTGKYIKSNGKTAKNLLKQYGGDYTCPAGFVKHAVTEYRDECAICLAEMTDYLIKTFPCCHVFHFDCAVDWFGTHSGKCPTCRKVVSENWWYNDKSEWIPSLTQ